MHQDQRIGLALAVLLLGAAGAFFFRHDARPATDSPRLRTAKQLDARIAEKAVSPYLQGIEDIDEPKGVTARKVSDRGGPPLSRDDDRSLPSLGTPDFFTEDSPEPFDATTHKARTRLPPEPADDDILDLAPIQVPDTDEITTHAVQAPENTPSGARSKPLEMERIHVVQKGESLSSIAAKELGSTNRFIEIYEANRDQLKDANDVRVGMKLRLPARLAAQSAKVGSTKSRPDLLIDSAPPLFEPANSRGTLGESPPIPVPQDGEAERKPTSDTAPAPAKKFVPAKRPPLGTRTPSPQTNSNADPKTQAGRRLSQLPPENSDGKVAR